MTRDTTFLLVLAIWVAASTLAGIGAIYAPGSTARIWVRRAALLLTNLSPWTIGISFKEFSTLQTFLAAWILSFIALGLAILALSHIVLA
jgi:hypothetical protein